VSKCGGWFVASALALPLACASSANPQSAIPNPHLPSFAAVRAAYQPSDVALLDRHGAVIHEMRIDSQRRRLAWTPLTDISPALQAAVIASEDRRFYQHHGVDGQALVAAATQLLRGGPRRGASTISMQLATRLASQRPPHASAWRALAQKWRQMQHAWALERCWSKGEILEAYLNLVTFRGELQGVAAATHVLFGKAPHGVTESEALVLAVLLRAPNAQPAAVTRRALALRTAVSGVSTPGDLTAAATQALSAPPGSGPRVALAPHAAHELLRGAVPTAPVHSTLDASVQRAATEALRRHLLALRERWVHDGAVLVVDNASGDVLAYVGGGDDLSSARHVDGIRARRQAGSALKPFLYALALEQRLLTPASLIEDTPLEIPVSGGLYRPQNYDEQFRGLVTVRTALSASLNIPAVRTLQLVGVDPFVQQLRRLGFKGLVESGEYYGPSLALGSADVSLWEMVNAYRTLANNGVWNPLRMRPHESLADDGQRLYSEEAAFLVSNILADRESRSVTFGLENPLVTRFWTAVKTGTSKEMRDNWCVGYSRRYTAGVWVGNFSGQPMRDVSGVSGAAPVWREVMNWLHRDTPSTPPAPPPGVRAATVTFARGIEAPRTEWFRDGTQPDGGAQRLAGNHAHIVAPAPGTIIALDPDIPASRQRVALEAQTAALGRWSMDGADLGASDQLVLWKPLPGRHTLQLLGDHEDVLDSVIFVVRGGM
jgi:penicillin-binding protein 1C